jgi:hypothetical protein
MPTALLIAAAFAVCFVLPGSASAKHHRSASVKREFQLTRRCPATGRTSGACPGYVKDHVVPLACGGPDTVSNLQWQTIRAAKAKDTWETKRRHPLGMNYRRDVPVTAMSTLRLPHCEQTRRRRRSGTGVSGPYQRACSAGSGSLW